MGTTPSKPAGLRFVIYTNQAIYLLCHITPSQCQITHIHTHKLAHANTTRTRKHIGRMQRRLLASGWAGRAAQPADPPTWRKPERPAQGVKDEAKEKEGRRERERKRGREEERKRK